MNRKTLKYAFIGGVAIGAIAAVILLTRGGKEESAKTGPVQTVEAFCRAVAEGRFDQARTLCDTLTMDGYIRAYEQEWERMWQQDSVTAGIAADILSQMEFDFGEVVREGDRRTVFYTMTGAQGRTKDKTATVRQEGGEWRVERITDRN